jgi:phage terminase small subunit
MIHPPKARPERRHNGLPRAPVGLSPAANRLWRGLVQEYALDDVAALAILEAGLQSFDRAATAKALLDADGPTVTDRWGQRKVHPAASVERDSRAAFLGALKQLCLDIEPLRIPWGDQGEPDADESKEEDSRHAADLGRGSNQLFPDRD